MKKVLLVISVLFLVCGCENKKDMYKTISCDEITSDMVVIDVRSENEYKLNHLENAINIDVDIISEDTVNIDKDKKIVVYCQSGSRSKIAYEKLVSLGYNNVYDLGAINNCIK